MVFRMNCKSCSRGNPGRWKGVHTKFLSRSPVVAAVTVCSAIAYQVGIIHGKLTPENLLQATDGSPRHAVFGLSADVSDTGWHFPVPGTRDLGEGDGSQHLGGCLEARSYVDRVVDRSRAPSCCHRPRTPRFCQRTVDMVVVRGLLKYVF